MKTFVLLLLLPIVYLAHAGSVHPQYKKEGCFKDNINNHVINEFSDTNRKNYLYWKKWPDMSLTINRCGAFAESKGCVLFAIQFWGECYCTRDAKTDYKKYGTGKEPTNCVNGLGKEGYNMVYSISGCYKNSHRYELGSNVPQVDPCMSCKCGAENKEICYAQQCLSDDKCAVTKSIAGQCCPVCACKDENKLSYNDGQTWVTKKTVAGHTQCFNCKCQNGQGVCDDYSCPTLTCTETVHKQGDCCPVCKPKAQPMTIPTRRPPPTLPDFSFPFPFPFPDDFKRNKVEIVKDMTNLVKRKLIKKKKAE